MARVPNNQKTTALRALAYIENKIHSINRALSEELNSEGKLDATYVAGRRAFAESEGIDLMKMWRWIWEDVNQLNRTPEAAFTDAEVDAIDEDIRTFEDGL